MDSDPVADNTRRCGAYDVNNGYFFQLIGTAFSIGTRTDASGSPVDTAVANGSFNGKLGSTWNPVVESHYKFEIEYGEFGAYWYVNDVLLHKSPSPHLSNVLTLPATMENVNTGSTTDSIFHCDGMAILRQGLLKTNPQSYYFAPGTTAGVNLKIGAGSVHQVIFGGAANNTIVTLADSTTAATPILWRYLASGALSVPISVDMGGMPFNTGLRLVVATGNAECTVVYE